MCRRQKVKAIVLLAAAVVLSAGMQTFAAEPAKKLHLMYLVTAKADDLKAGSVVAVEPAFFTDGERIVFAYDYCLALEAAELKPQFVEEKRLFKMVRMRSVDDLRPIDEWCGKREANIRAEGMLGLDNEGASIALASLSLSQDDKRSGKATLKSIRESANPSQVLANHRRYRFFLLAADQSLVRRVVPTWRVSDEQAKQLTNVLEKAEDRIRGTVHIRCAASDCKTGWMQKEKQFVSPALPFEFVSAMFVDTDRDREPDLMVGLRSVDKNTGYLPLIWQGMAIVRLDHEPWVRANVEFLGEDSLEAFDTHAVFFYVPKIVLQTSACIYLMTATEIHEQAIDLVAMPDTTKKCPHRQTRKTPAQPDD